MKRHFIKIGIGLTITCLLTGCFTKEKLTDQTVTNTSSVTAEQQNRLLNYKVDPETFALYILDDERSFTVSDGFESKQVTNFTEQNALTSWSYPEQNMEVAIQPRDGYLQVRITKTAESDLEFTWPQIKGESYFLPFGEGKRIPSGDAVWSEYLSGEEFEVPEQLSMSFVAATQGDKAILVIMENPFRTSLQFSEQNEIAFSVSHSYPQIDPEKSNTFRIYLTEAAPAAVAKQYKDYRKETGDFVTLSEKAAQNPDIEKLYGAPHIYFAGDFLLSPDDVNWPAFRKETDSPVMQYLLSFHDKTESGAEITAVISSLKNQDYVDTYQKNVICNYLSSVLRLDDFYNKEILTESNEKIRQLLAKENLIRSDLLELNRQLLSCNMKGVFQNADTWMNSQTVDVIQDLKASGIDQAWIGLHNWEQALSKPELVAAAADNGYLIAPYDSYHSIHEPGKEKWNTAQFSDQSLYENATISRQDGEKVSGFQNVGRKLNPVLSLPSVKNRLDEILSNPVAFNSWFIDCDATGEIYDDYTPGHETTQQQDLQARLNRMTVIRDEYNMVIGSEGGHDFASSVIAFAHGIELRSFSWMDEDMKNNKDSEYYMGKYYNPAGGVPEHFSKRIPVKETLYTLFVDPAYDLPLYKLVYNDSVITASHWDWSTFKIKGGTKDRMLREILYNVPPLFHLDAALWEEYREDIIAHNTVWSQFSKKVITEEMTEYLDLSGDGTLQLTRFGSHMTVVANFAAKPAAYEGTTIPAKTVLMIEDGAQTFYTPSMSADHE